MEGRCLCEGGFTGADCSEKRKKPLAAAAAKHATTTEQPAEEEDEAGKCELQCTKRCLTKCPPQPVAILAIGSKKCRYEECARSCTLRECGSRGGGSGAAMVESRGVATHDKW